jgi:hypothetical protein
LEKNSTLESTPLLQIWFVWELNWTCFPAPFVRDGLITDDERFRDSRIREALTFDNDRFNDSRVRDSRIRDGLNSNPSKVEAIFKSNCFYGPELNHLVYSISSLAPPFFVRRHQVELKPIQPDAIVFKNTLSIR